MAEPFLGEMRCFAFNFAPRGWAKCDGQLLPINQNQALFSLLGTIYGGNGRTDFRLPDLITIVDFETARPINAERLRFGQRVSVFRIGSPAHYTTPEGLASLRGLIDTVTD